MSNAAAALRSLFVALKPRRKKSRNLRTHARGLAVRLGLTTAHMTRTTYLLAMLTSRTKIVAIGSHTKRARMEKLYSTLIAK
jgi:hypothetical protein